jgi:hypothetical protein
MRSTTPSRAQFFDVLDSATAPEPGSVRKTRRKPIPGGSHSPSWLVTVFRTEPGLERVVAVSLTPSRDSTHARFHVAGSLPDYDATY